MEALRIDYQMRKTIGKIFTAKTKEYEGSVRILGSWYEYKVIEGLPYVGAFLEVVDFTSEALLVVVNLNARKGEVAYVG